MQDETETRGLAALIRELRGSDAGLPWPEICERFELEPEYRESLEAMADSDCCTPLEALACVVARAQARVDLALAMIEQG